MAVVPATLLYRLDFPGVQNTCLFRYTFPSVAATTTSDEIEFEFDNQAKIENIRISCDSTNYNFSLRLESGVTPPSIEEIYDVINANDTYLDNRVNVYWGKQTGATEDCLYGVIKNLDSSATGLITFEFVMTCF